jgi:hypothetical protein
VIIQPRFKPNICQVLETDPTTCHESTGGVWVLLYSFFNLGASWWWMVITRFDRFLPENDPVPISEEAGLTPGPVWTDAEKSRPNRDSIPGLSSHWRVAIPTELSRPTTSTRVKSKSATMSRGSAVVRDKSSGHCTSLTLQIVPFLSCSQNLLKWQKSNASISSAEVLQLQS